MNHGGTIILVGMKHSGKTSTGKALAGLLDIPFLDTDDIMHTLSGLSPRELWDSGGAQLMMDWETKACEEVLNTTPNGVSSGRCVLATGGGIADNTGACALLPRIGTVVFLNTAFSLLFERVQQSATKDGRLPPFLQGDNPEQKFRELFSRRTAIYATIAEVSVEPGRLTPSETALQIMDLLANE